MALDLGTLRGDVDLDIAAFEKKYKQVIDFLGRLASMKIPDLEVDADVDAARKALTRLGDMAEELASLDPVIQLDADIAQATRNVADIEGELEALRSQDATVQVEADVADAEKRLASAEAELRQLQGARATITVGADTGAVDAAMEDVEDKAAAGGEAAGGKAGDGLVGGIVAALATIPVAGAIVGIGKAIGDQLMAGLQVEVRGDRFMALTGLDEEAAAKFGRAAADSYANNFGESIEGNLDAARAAVQSGLLDPAATKAASQEIIEQLTGVADLLGEDVPAVARSASQAIRTGMAVDAKGAFDLLVKGVQSGLNVSEDLLDTFDEYGTQFRKLGLDGPQALGLLSQAVKAGARDTDLAADALKEFSIRAIDGSELSRGAFQALGLSADEMTAKIAAGGPSAAEGLEQVLTGLRGIEDPARRAEIAVGLFGTQAEDLGEALYAMDTSTAVAQLGEVEGAASRALSTLGDNSAGALESAQRNIQVAADGIAGALATAFAPQIEGFADFVSSNREAVLQFLLDAANGAIDFARALLNGAADATEAFGSFVGTVGPAILDMVEEAIDGFTVMAYMLDPTGILGMKDAADSAADSFGDIREQAETNFQALEDGSKSVADTIRTDLIANGLDPAQERLNTFADPLILDAAVNDSVIRLANDIDSLGSKVGDVTPGFDAMTGSIDTSTAAGAAMDGQIQAVVGSLGAQLAAAAATGETNEELTGRVNKAREAFVNQMIALGMTSGAANTLADSYGLIPSNVNTMVVANTATAQANVDAVYGSVQSINGYVATVTIQTQGVSAALNAISTIVGQMNSAGFAEGGYTGPGGKYDVAGVVHRGEFVFDQEKTNRYRPLFEAIHAGKLPGYEGGGYVEAPALTPAAAPTLTPAAAAPGPVSVSLEGATVAVRIGDLGPLVGVIEAVSTRAAVGVQESRARDLAGRRGRGMA